VAKALIQQADSYSNTVEQSHTLSASVQTGDVVFAVHGNNYYTLARLETPGGTGVTTWEQLTACTLDMGTNDLHGKVWKGTVTTASGTVTENAGGTDEERYFGIWVFREGDFDAGGSNNSETTTTSHVAPSLTPTAGKTDDHYVGVFVSEGGQVNYTPPGAPWNARTERDTGFNTYRGGEELLTSDAASGTRTSTSSASTKFGTMAFLVKGTAAGTTPVGKDLGLPWNTRASVGDPVQLIWNVEFLEPTFVADRASLAPVISSEASTLVDMAGAGSITTGPDRYLIARVSANNSGTSGAACTLTVSDARNGSWIVHGPGLQDPGAADAGVACYVAIVKVTNAYTNGDDVTFTWSPNCTGKTIVIEEWRGIHSSSPVAVVATTAAGASGTPSISRTPTAAGQLFYGCLAIEGLLADTYTQDSDTTDGTWSGRTSQGGTGTATSTVTVRGATKLVTGTSAQTWNPAITSRDWAAVALVLAPYVATTPVGKELGLVWDTRAPIGDTVQTVWDTRAPIGDTVQALWNTRAVVADSAQFVWDTLARFAENLLPNSSFELDANADGLADGLSEFGNPTTSLVTSPVSGAGLAQRLTVAAASNEDVRYAPVTITAQQAYTLSVYAKVNALEAGANFVLKVEWLDSTGALVNYDYTTVGAPDGGAVRRSFTSTPGIGAVTGRVVFAIEGGGQVDLDQAQLELGSTATVWNEVEADWIMRAVMTEAIAVGAGGAIGLYVDRVAIRPYEASWAALGLAAAYRKWAIPSYADALWNWVDWYAAHMETDGTVYDYDIVGGVLTELTTRDSTDSYAGMFLLAVRAADLVDPRSARLDALEDEIVKAVDAIELTQQADGLTWAKPEFHVKYLMDQAETLSGLRAAVHLLAELGDTVNMSRARTDAEEMRAGLETLWNASTPVAAAYDWAKHDNDSLTVTTWSVFGDALQQSAVVAFRVLPASRHAGLMTQFDVSHPDGDWLSYNANVGLGFETVGNATRAQEYAANVRSRALSYARAWDYNPMKAGWVTLTALSAEDLIQTDVDAIGDTLQAVWDTRAPIGDPLQTIWDARASIGDPLEALWSTRALASDTVQALWDLRAALADDLQLVWNVEAAALAAVGKELGLLWDIRALVADQLQAVWDTRASIGDPVDLLWSTRALAGDTVQGLWDTRALAGDTLESLWSVRQALGDPLGMLWDTRAVIGDELNAQWGVRISAGDSFEALWTTRALAGDQIQLLWDVNGVLAAIGKNLGLLWDTRAPASGTIQALWDIRTPVSDAVALEWGVRTMIGDSVQALWTIRALVGDEAALLWSTRAVAGDTVQALWDIRAFIGDNVILQWNVESLVPPAIIPDKLILSSVPDNLHGLEAVPSTLTLTALED